MEEIQGGSASLCYLLLRLEKRAGQRVDEEEKREKISTCADQIGLVSHTRGIVRVGRVWSTWIVRSGQVETRRGTRRKI